MKPHRTRPLILRVMTCSLFLAADTFVEAQQKTANYDESKVGNHPLPPVLGEGNSIANSSAAWEQNRRPELFKLFEEHVYGQTPQPNQWGPVEFKILAEKKDALGGKATRQLILATLPQHPSWKGMEIMLHIPNEGKGPFPCFIMPSFGGNHAVSTEPDVPLSTRWMRPNKEKNIVANRATEATRGTESSRWPLTMIMDGGFAVATYYYGDVEPDHPDGWREGLRAALSKDGADTNWQPGQWGAIGAWAWGLSRIADYVEKQPRLRGDQLIVLGHSRLGKTALWAGAQDKRFGVVISNNSGEGGAALMRRNFGETTAVITKAFPHWFTSTYSNYANNETSCPVDSHELIALMAPRPVYIASAVEDTWADPKGEFLAGLHAQPAYDLYGKKGLGTETHPGLNQPVGEHIGYHIRSGKHDVTDYDWQQFMAFARRHFKTN